MHGANRHPAKRGRRELVRAPFRSSSPSSVGDQTALYSGRTLHAGSRALIRSTQQRIQTTAGRRTKQISDGDQQRERQANVSVEERKRNDIEILRREDGGRGNKQNDDGKVQPAHRAPPSRLSRRRGVHLASYALNCAAQTQAQSDPADRSEEHTSELQSPVHLVC